MIAKELELALWHDVFVEQQLPWGRFLQSVLLHTVTVAILWAISLAWIRQQKILTSAAFDRTALVTYTPEEYLPPLNTGAAEPPKARKGNPIYAKQAILSVPPEADNRSQTIVAPPDLKLNRDVPLPNIIATGTVAPAVPLDATQARLNRIIAPETQVVAPAPEVEFARDRVIQAAMKSDVVAAPPELTQRSTRGKVGLVNIGPSDVIAPAPQLTLAEQHSLARGGHLAGSVQPVAPPPSVGSAGGARAGGRLIALGIHPVAPNGPVAVPEGNRRGTFAATPQGKQGAAGTPDLPGSNTAAKNGGFKAGNHSTLPSGLYVGAAGDPNHVREMASLSSPGTSSGPKGASRAAAVVPDNKLTDADRQVFGGKRLYEMRLNMPNLNSASGSWVMKFAELDGGKHEGELLTPILVEKIDPGYPLELMRANVHGMVTLYAVIHPDGKVGDIRVLSSPDERLDPYAAKALARWKFAPAERAGKAVALEAVVQIPFRAKTSF
ncbi:MAG TPA: energy transducer TonB [Terriglobales bacterium]|nr:energy transducer TonB [Terriglobales bacterium]